MPSMLVVDDSKLIRDSVTFALETAGYTSIETAEDGARAFFMAEKKAYDLVVTDINMPNMNGLELCRALRKLPDFRTTPIIVLTTESSDDMKQKGQEAGASAWMIKPFVPDDLLYVVETLLET